VLVLVFRATCYCRNFGSRSVNPKKNAKEEETTSGGSKTRIR
jgi:hypothetical protein